MTYRSIINEVMGDIAVIRLNDEKSLVGSYGGSESNPLMPMMNDRRAKGFALIEERLGHVPYFAGQEFTAADIIMFFPLSTMRAFTKFDLSGSPQYERLSETDWGTPRLSTGGGEGRSRHGIRYRLTSLRDVRLLPGRLRIAPSGKIAPFFLVGILQ